MPNKNRSKKEPKRTYAALENVQVEQNTNYFSSFCGMNSMMPKNIMKYEESDSTERVPYLNITMQPADTFRYRYESEKGSHGGIKGEVYSRSKKCFPEVKLENAPLNNIIKIKVSLYTNDKDPKLHVYELTGKNCQNGVCLVDLNEDFTASFPSLTIQAKKKEEVPKILLNRKISENGLTGLTQEMKTSLEKEVQEEVKKINLDSARLCFEAFSEDYLNDPICDPVFSNPINNQKSAASGDLKIDRLSRITGKCSGGDEVFLFCEKVKKEDIQVRFREKDDKNNILWEALGNFSPVDVHHQVAIAFKTPQYKSVNIETAVHIELFRPSDGKCSEPLAFTYVPDDEVYGNSRKRKRVDSLYPSIPESSFVCSKCSSNLLEDLLSTGFSENAMGEEAIEINDDFYNTLFATDDENLDPIIPGFSTTEWTMPQCFVDSASSLPDNFASLSLDEERKQSCPNKVEKTRQKLEDYVDGINKILNNREKSTYLFYGSRLLLIQDEYGNSMLHLAILEQSENLNLIQIMLNMISEKMINKTNKFKETPLHLAVKGNHFNIVFLLLVKGADPNISDLDGNNCLHLAAQRNSIQCMKMLLPENEMSRKYKITQIDTLNHNGMSPLHIAIVYNFEDCVNFLLDAKADVNLCEIKCGQSPLHLAVEHPNLMIKILKQPNIDVQAKDFRGYTAFYLVCIKNGISFKKLPKDIESDALKIIKFLENLDVQKIRELKTSESESTDSSDYEDAAVHQILHPGRHFGGPCDSLHLPNAVNCTSTLKDNENTNGSESFFMKIEKELCNYLDSDDNWKKLAEFIGIDIEYLDVFEKNLSPGKTVIKFFKEKIDLDVNKMKEYLGEVGLEEGVRILQRTNTF